MGHGGKKQWKRAIPVVILTAGAAMPLAAAQGAGSPEPTAAGKASDPSPTTRGVISLNYLLDNHTPLATAVKPVKPAHPPLSLTDKLLLARAQRIEAEISKAAGLQKTVDVELDCSDQVNSWTEGHTVTITAGLMRFVADDNELAAVLGHETGHIRAGHIGKEGRANIWALIGTALVSAVGGQNATLASYVSSELVLRKYSRDEESEADRIGLELMQAAGYDGHAMG
ncbi:MAG: M48 family metalloprotease, partial [Armatimonadota bacterium]|nr:M48 family metalloprotease [Armatimonadota bacterium]